MADKTTNTLEKVLDELKMTIALKGMKATIAALQTARQVGSQDVFIRFVLLTVCSDFKVSPEQLKQDIREDHVIMCKAFIIHYLHERETPWYAIRQIFNRDRSRLHRIMQLVKKLNARLPGDRGWIEKKQQLDELIKNYNNPPKK
jgi:glycerol-3-phosphate responsive antiterminator